VLLQDRRDPAQHVVAGGLAQPVDRRLEPGETKNEEARTIPLMGELRDMLTIQKQTRDQKWPTCEWVFFRYGKKIKDFRGAWVEACRRCGEIFKGRPANLLERRSVPGKWY
jgi:hypothetical protein